MAEPILIDRSGHNDPEKQGKSLDQHLSSENTVPPPRTADDKSQSSEASLDEKPPSTQTVTKFRWFLICVATLSANVLYGLDTTITADIQGAVSETFHNVNQLGWLGVGFTLGSTVAILPLGKVYAMFDTKWLFIGCLLMFASGSAVCGAAPSMNAMIVGRVWAGMGGAGMYLG